MKLQHNIIFKQLIPFFAVACILGGCSKTPSTAVEKNFDEYTNQLFMDEISSNTINLHYTLAHPENYGITDYTPTLGSFDIDETISFKDSLIEMKEEIYSFDYNTLSKEQQLTYDIITDYIDTSLSVSDLFLYDEPLSPTIGYQSQLPILLAEYTFRTERDIEDYLALASQIEEIFDSILLFERKKSSAGLFMADFAVDDIVEQMQEFIASPSDNYMIEVFNDKIDEFPNLTDAKKQEYKDKNYEIITSSIVPAYETLIDGLSSLKGTGQNPGGLCYFPKGNDYYKYLVRSKTGSSKSVLQLKQKTERYIADALLEMQQLMQENPSLMLSFDDYTFHLTEPEDILDDLVNKIEKDFPKAPDVNYTVKYVHESMEEHSSPAFYLTPPIDDVQNNIIYINKKSADEKIYPTIAHEGYPGHLYQTVYTSSKQLPLVRNLFGFSGYTEGWATYVEHYSYHISGLDDDLARMLSLNSSASLGLYAYVDLSIHNDGWDEDDVYSYLSMFGFDDKEIAQEIFCTMVEEPANYLSYFIGYLEFLELREEAEKLCGADFSLKEFHDIIMTIGPTPFDILSKYMKIAYES